MKTLLPQPGVARVHVEPELNLDALTRGRRFPAVPIDLDGASVDAYLEVTGERHPLYGADNRRWVPPLYPTQVRFIKHSLGGRWPSGTIQVDQQLAAYRPLHQGEILTLDTVVSDTEIQADRRRFELMSTLRDEEHRIVSIQRSTALYLDPATTAERRSRPSAPPPSPDSGASRLSDRYSLERLRAFGRVAGANDPIHIDPGFAAHSPQGGNIVQGRLVLALISRLMVERFGVRWIEAGGLEVRFRRPVRVDDLVTAWLDGSPDTSNRYRLGCHDSCGQLVFSGLAQAGSPGPGASGLSTTQR
ncbi:MAG: hypothetical protein M0R28_15080 [Pigmentiphaga sp.]|nr:hypothetical protein [Pigmentiphaga sp.]